MARVNDFAAGAAPQNSKATAAMTLPIKTSVVRLGPNRYGTTSRPSGARRGKSRYN